MEERKNLFEMIKEVCDENDCLHEQNNCLKKRNKCLQEEINNRENARIDCDAYVRKLLKERNELREEIDNNGEIIQSLHDEIEARCTFTKKVIKERDELQEKIDDKDEIIQSLHDEIDVQCEDYCKIISERVNIDNLHIILAKYLTDNYTPEPTKICFFQFLDEIKKFIDSNQKEC